MKNDESRLLREALLFEEGHPRRTQHILKVYALAKLFGEQEGLSPREQRILRAAAILHDIAIKPCKEKYGDACQENQRREAPAIARAFLSRAEYQPDDVPRILELILLHHCYDRIDGRDFQLLVEADLIAGCWECGDAREQAAKVRPLFRSGTGTQLIALLCGGA